ncbi:thiosulfate oxidation carrier complex protein SoxZ [Methylomonas sp. MgM2]
MASQTKIRVQRGERYTELKILIRHPMENGRNRDPITGQLIPAHFIQELTIEKNGKTIIVAELGGSMSKDPFFTFRLKTANGGDRLKVRWTDNLGFSDRVEHTIDHS